MISRNSPHIPAISPLSSEAVRGDDKSFFFVEKSIYFVAGRLRMALSIRVCNVKDDWLTLEIFFCILRWNLKRNLKGNFIDKDEFELLYLWKFISILRKFISTTKYIFLLKLKTSKHAISFLI